MYIKLCKEVLINMPYGISAYGQSPQIGSPLQHTGSLIQHMGSGTATIYAGSESNGSPAAAVTSTALQTTSSQSTSSLFRTGDEKRLTREAMERYLRDRNDMIIVVLHAKVINVCLKDDNQWKSLFVCISLLWLLKQLLRISSFSSDVSTYFQLSSSWDYLKRLSLKFKLKKEKKCFASFRIKKFPEGKLFN